ncbi:hypothetical protein [Chitinivibrio alkaliphilus]|uniref:Uncharacterized protein n=1 Tax=Chitinivibrio alkaliphilus ACht1 TaxID=1313304 RepID=U7D8N7_9BACT|nr:hypothetical protein [Chitinivibrio alkaliphilus]ERP30795.1 hypothetical protein CALK_2361 [Chitinivibrio alkaliphilus ACht1]
MDIADIQELAQRYVAPDDMSVIPAPGELFSLHHTLLGHDLGEQFGGYGVVMAYEEDPSAKPRGKWVYLTYLSLESFPPARMQLKLQPPHIALGKFQNPERTIETRICAHGAPLADDGEAHEQSHEGHFLQFPGKK